jgi:dihydroneopterin aldolase
MSDERDPIDPEDADDRELPSWGGDPFGPSPRDEDSELEGEGAEEPTVTVEITGLSLYTRHGASEAERELGQRLVFDVSFELDKCDATVTDRLEDTVDYAEVCEQVALTAQGRSYRTLERLCAAVADRLTDRYGAEAVRVKAAKPEPPLPLPVEEVSVELYRES